MPHVIVKLWPGKSEEQKARLAKAITRDVMELLGYGDESVSVSMEEVEPRDWAEQDYKPDIVSKPDQLYKKPGLRPVRIAVAVMFSNKERNHARNSSVRPRRHPIRGPRNAED